MVLIKEGTRRKGLAISERGPDYYLDNLENEGLV